MVLRLLTIEALSQVSLKAVGHQMESRVGQNESRLSFAISNQTWGLIVEKTTRKLRGSIMVHPRMKPASDKPTNQDIFFQARSWGWQHTKEPGSSPFGPWSQR